MGLLVIEDLKNKYNVDIRGVIYIGAHKGEDVDEYAKCGVEKFILIEPIPYNCDEMKRKWGDNPNIQIYEYAMSDTNGQAEFYVTNHTMSSSLLKLEYHKVIEPNVKEVETINVTTKRFETFVEENNIDMKDYNFVSIDVQGAEMFVFRGFGDLFRHIDYILSEVNRAELYKGCVQEDELNNFLGSKGFVKKEENFVVPSWGDVFYERVR